MDLDAVAIVSLAAVMIIGAIWLYRGQPSVQVAKKYPKLVFLQCAIPFSGSWRNKIDSSDLGEFERYRKRFLVYYCVFLIGTSYRWHENGVIAITGNHVDGEQHGVWIFRDEGGRITRRVHWDKGKVVSSQTTREETNWTEDQE